MDIDLNFIKPYRTEAKASIERSPDSCIGACRSRIIAVATALATPIVVLAQLVVNVVAAVIFLFPELCWGEDYWENRLIPVLTMVGFACAIPLMCPAEVVWAIFTGRILVN